MHATPDLTSFLGRSFDCQCGRRHEVPVEAIVSAEDAITRLPDMLANRFSGRSATLLADRRTLAVAGTAVEASLGRAGWKVRRLIVPDGGTGSPVCDDLTLRQLAPDAGSPDLFIAVGSGVINDLTKWLAFEANTPYLVVATAATMNGYTAANVAPAIDGVKSLVHARAPVAVYAVPSVIEQAPFRLTAAGLGDALAKSVSVADWKLNHLQFGEHFCPYCADIVAQIEPLYFDHPENVAQRKPEGIQAVFDALIYSGLAMTMIGSSAPASGGEHLFSHTLDMMSSIDGIPHDLHGRQVGLGTILAAALYDRLLALEAPAPVPLPETIDHAFWGRLADPVAAQYAAKQDHFRRLGADLTRPGAWADLLRNLRGHVTPPQKIADCLQRAGAARFIEDIQCDRRRVRQAVLHMHEIRKRCTVVDLAWLMGLLPGAAEELIDQWLVG